MERIYLKLNRKVTDIVVTDLVEDYKRKGIQAIVIPYWAEVIEIKEVLEETESNPFDKSIHAVKDIAKALIISAEDTATQLQRIHSGTHTELFD